jgi:periplasmic divalent cation tolerance protein
MISPRILYITTGSRDEAREIGETLVKEKLCACVNILSDMESLYWWEGEVQNDFECILLVKTTADFVDRVTERVKDLHSYDVPCVISLPLSPNEGNSEYLDWLERCVSE